MVHKNKIIVIFFGPPASGKGTQAGMLGEKLTLPVISPGELLRHERDKKSAVGKKAEVLIREGKLVEDEIVENLITARLKKKDAKDGFILDGYPRRQSQLNKLRERLDEITGENDKIAAIDMDTDDDVVIKRISGRRVCDCGASYHLEHKPPKHEGICDECGQKLYQRQDDTPKVITRRLEMYHGQIKPLLSYFKNKNQLIIVDGAETIDKVEENILKSLNNISKQ